MSTIRPLTEVNKDLFDKQQSLAEFVKANTNADGSYSFDGDGLKAFSDRNAELEQLANEAEQARSIETAMKRTEELKGLQEVGNRLPFSASGGDPQAQAQGEIKSLADHFIENPNFQGWLEHFKTYQSTSTAHQFEVLLPSDVMNAMKATNTTATTLPYPTQRPGFIPYATRRPVVADLIPQSQSDQPAIVYLEQTGQNFAAAPVAEGGLKPESDFAWTQRNIPFETIAHWTKVTNQALEDTVSLRDRLNDLLSLGLQLAEEDQILNGSGTTPQLQGFLTKSGVQTVAKGADDVFTAFLSALTKVRFTGRATPTGAIFHPNDWQTLMTTKTTNGRFIFGDPAMVQQNQAVWGVNYVVTDAMTENTSLIGDFASYSRLYRKGGIRVLVGTEGDDLKRNIQTMVVEERVALEIGRASAFVKLTGI